MISVDVVAATSVRMTMLVRLVYDVAGQHLHIYICRSEH